VLDLLAHLSDSILLGEFQNDLKLSASDQVSMHLFKANPGNCVDSKGSSGNQKLAGRERSIFARKSLTEILHANIICDPEPDDSSIQFK
jgi:hypothetical protein